MLVSRTPHTSATRATREASRSKGLGRSSASTLTYVYVGGIYLKRAWGSACENMAVMVAIGLSEGGRREIIGCAEGPHGVDRVLV
jgi:transposase-like protein